MNIQPLVKYYKKGLLLLKQSKEILLISILFSFIVDNTFQLQGVYGVVVLALFLPYLSFSFSIPTFLQQKQKHQSVEFSEMIPVVLKNMKRLLTPIALTTLFGLLVIFILSFLWFTVFGNKPIIGPMNEQTPIEYLLRLVPIVFTIIGCLFAFTPIFFVIENQGLFQSMKKSVMFSIKNIDFVLTLLALSLIMSALFIFAPAQNLFVRVLLLITDAILSLWLVASTLYYYQTHAQKS